jgi:hypothetical protein
VKTDVGQPVIRTIATTFGFKNLPEFEKVAKRESLGFQGELEQTTTPSAIGHGTKPDHSSNIVNTDESQYGGEIQPVDFQGVDLVAPADAAGLEKFTEAIERIAANHSQPQQRLNFIEVPGEKSCCRHANGSKRACAVVEVTQESIVTCYILELARVDGKSTSTLFFCLLSQPDSKRRRRSYNQLARRVRQKRWSLERRKAGTKFKLEGTTPQARLKSICEQLVAQDFKEAC